MAKPLILLVGVSIFAISFPSIFDEYRAKLSTESGAEALDPAAPVVNASLPPPSGKTRLVAGPDGHFRAEARLNGRTVEALVDTGATYVAMNEGTAKQLGIRLAPQDFRYSSETANGTVPVALARIATVRLGGVEVRDVEAAVSRGEGLNTVLLGMSFLKKLSRYEVASGRLDLTR